jgi:alkylhydroperoxidase family enzyme
MRTMTAGHDAKDAPATGAVGLLGALGEVPRSARWVLPALAAAFRGTDDSTLDLRVRTLVLLRVAAIDRAPYWRLRLEAAGRELGITEEELALVRSDEWELSPGFSDRERAAILWADRVARRLARRDSAAYEIARRHFSDRELVELTLMSSLGAMADRLTNALRVAPEPPIGMTPGAAGSADAALQAWFARMFNADVSVNWLDVSS